MINKTGIKQAQKIVQQMEELIERGQTHQSTLLRDINKMFQ